MELEFRDGVARRVDFLINSGYPAGYPRTALVDRPGPQVWPHIERDGILCLLPNMAEVDAEVPGAVAVHLLARSARLIDELIDGSIVERDFREEFLTYWFYSSDNDAPRICSILHAGPPSRLVCVWRDEKGLTIVGEDETSLKQWLCKRYGAPSRPKSFHVEPAAMLWLPEPPLPAAYPRTGADLILLARRIGKGAEEILASAAAAIADETLVLMGAEGRGGAGLIAATTTSAKPARSRTGNIERPLTRGFRDSNLDNAVATLRTYSAAPLLRSTVERADAEWIHGRGKDPRTAILLNKRVTVIGCGSVGSSVASRLARAGVGILDFVDYDELKWANVGRHELGAEVCRVQ